MKYFAIAFCTFALVACGGGGSTATTAIVPGANDTPVANAGIDQKVLSNSVVTLDGSKSSDANNDPLTYTWTLISKPPGSSAVIATPSSAKPSFTADSAGTYTASLIVNDGKANSNTDTVDVTVTVDNAAPVASAGVTQSVAVGTVVTLDASASTDANQDQLTYTWTLTTKPVGSAAVLSSLTSAKPTFIADVAGSYSASVVVNDGKVNSTNAASVVVTAAITNAAPVANAGIAQTVAVGANVTLDGSASSDANGDPLTYLWTLTGKPVGSTAILSNATIAKPTFPATIAGTYVATLVVNDGKVNSQPVTVSVTAAVPIAMFTTAPANLTVRVGGQSSYTVSGGTAPYTATSTDLNVVGVSVNASVFTIKSIGTGNAKVRIIDSLGTQVLLDVTAPAAIEREYNDERTFANVFLVNEQISGSLSSNSDVDWFAIDIDHFNGLSNINFEITNSNPGLGFWNVNFFDPDLQSLIGFNVSPNAGFSGKRVNIPTFKVGRYYVRVRSENATFYNGSPFVITVNLVPN